MKKIIGICLILLQGIIFSGCGQNKALDETLKGKETVISDYKEGGMFSPQWAVYFSTKGEGEKQEAFIELNGKKMGPFENYSDLVSFSPNGKKVIFTAKKKGSDKWDIYENGKKKWSHNAIAWVRYSWPMGLKGDMLRTQSYAAVFEQSDDNKLVSYFTSRKKGDKTLWANTVNGKEGKYYENTGNTIKFVDGKPAYWAWKKDNKRYLVVGGREYGPYEGVSSMKVSDDKKHFSFTAGSEGKNVLVMDGKNIKIPGESEGFVLGNNGKYGVAYKKDGKVHVLQSGKRWPKTYDATVWHQLRMTPDGKTLAGWFKRDGQWYVSINGKKEYGPYESYYFVAAGENYGLFLGKDGKNAGYYVRRIEGTSTGSKFYINGKAFKHKMNFGGIGLSYYQDDFGKVVGVGLMSSVDADMAAIADAAAAGAENPAKARYVGSHLIYTMSEDDSVYVVDGKKKSGPFKEAGYFIASPDGKHYAYIVEDENGKQAVVDGKARTPYYEGIYKLQFPEEDEVAFLTIKDDKVVRVAFKIK